MHSDRLPFMHQSEWFENDEFWTATYAFMFPQGAFDRAVDQIPKIVSLTECTDGASVLDLGCGPGRHAVPFAKQGFNVTGVDRSAFLLDKAKAYAERERVNVTWIEEDMRRFAQPDKFNLAMSMFTSFGFFDDMKDNHTVVQNVYRSLASRGVLVIDVMGKEVLAKTFQSTGSQALENGDLLFQRRFVCDDWERIGGEWVLVSSCEAKDISCALVAFLCTRIEGSVTRRRIQEHCDLRKS